MHTNSTLSFFDESFIRCKSRLTRHAAILASPIALSSFLVCFLGNPGHSYAKWCVAIMVLQAIVGSAGFLLHVLADLHGPSQRLLSNIVSGAPPFAPLLLPNLAILGFLGLATSKDNQPTEDTG
jgi:hypothetical protein